MLLIAGLLIAAEVITYIILTQGGGENIAMYCAVSRPNLSDTAYLIPYLLPILIWLVAAYVNRLTPIYAEDRGDPSRSWLFHYMMLKVDPHYESTEPVEGHVEAIRRIKKIKNEQGVLLRALIWYELFRHAYLQLTGSFLWDLMWMSFALIYGISQLVVTWVQNSTQSDGNNAHFLFDMGFGQIVSIILLLLPALAALEVLYGMLKQSMTRILGNLTSQLPRS